MMPRPGAALLELLTTSVLLTFVCAACAALLRADALIVTRTAEAAATDEALRIAASVIRSELRTATERDIRSAAADSIAARIFRGYAVVCASNGMTSHLRYRGLRAPDASKDSLLITEEELAISFRLSSTGPNSCAPNRREEIIAATTPRPLRLGSLLLFFESGSYHLSGKALRYRRGAEGRQPLSDERFDDARSTLQLSPNGRLVTTELTALQVGNDAAHLRQQTRLLNQR